MIEQTGTIDMDLNALQLLHLLQLSSPTLPVGGFAWSQGLETALELGWVSDEKDLHAWLKDVARRSFVYQEWPLLFRLHRSIEQNADVAINDWNATALALRETHELYQQDTKMGAALITLLRDLNFRSVQAWQAPATSYVTAFAFAAVEKQLSSQAAAIAMAWSWLENQIAVAIKTMPMGQTAGQRIFYQIAAVIPNWLKEAQEVVDEDVGLSLPGVVMGSMLHEVQYSRLFRS